MSVPKFKDRRCVHGNKLTMRLQMDMGWCQEPSCWRHVIHGAGYIPRSVGDPAIELLREWYEQHGPTGPGGKQIPPAALVAMSEAERSAWDYDNFDRALRTAKELFALDLR